MLTASINCLTSFLAGFVIFSVLGYMAHVQNKHISEVGEEGKEKKYYEAVVEIFKKTF